MSSLSSINTETAEHGSVIFLHSPYHQFYIVAGMLVIVLLVSRMSSHRLLQSGMYISILWLVPSLFYGVFTTHVWQYLLNLAVTMVLFYVLWIGLLVICEKRGKAYPGDGWWGMLVPLYFIVLSAVLALVMRGLLPLFR